jgi:hypothetical protein
LIEGRKTNHDYLKNWQALKPATTSLNNLMGDLAVIADYKPARDRQERNSLEPIAGYPRLP